jgi:acylphosphatase
MREVLRMEVFGRINNYYLPRYFYFTSSFMHYALAYPVACLMLPGIIYYGYKRKLAEYKFLYLLMGWVLIIMIGMSIPDDKKIRYILPIVPACALIAAYPFHAAANNPYFIFLRTWFRRLFFIVPMIFVILIFASHHLYATHVADHELMIVFAILQLINVLTIIFIRHIQIREMIFLMQALICFALSLFIIIEPVELYINRARDFVYAVEEQRKQQNAQLVFYRETADGMPIKYRINQINADQPRFIADQQLLMQVAEPAMFVTSKEYFISLSQNIAQSLHVIAEDALGHERVMVFIKKQKVSLMSKLCIHCFVAGKVQGVWFRATTQEQAKRLGITGWARNLPDGRVEVMACGDKEKLAELHAWLQRGPERAEVKELSYQELPWEEISGFETL